MRKRAQELGSKNLVGARLGEVRKNQGMKQKELLALLQVSGIDVSGSALSKIEGQHRFVVDYELLALADVFNVSVDWLLTGKNEVEDSPKEKNKERRKQ